MSGGTFVKKGNKNLVDITQEEKDNALKKLNAQYYMYERRRQGGESHKDALVNAVRDAYGAWV